MAIDCHRSTPVSRVGTLEYLAPEIVRLDDSLREPQLDELRRRGRPLYSEKVRGLRDPLPADP